MNARVNDFESRIPVWGPSPKMFRDRTDAASRLTEELKDRDLYDPLVLAIPRGGVVIGAILARALNADLDVVLSRKLPAPGQPELAMGAVCEDGDVYLNDFPLNTLATWRDDIAAERIRQIAEIERRKTLFRSVRGQAPVAGRSIIVTDDGIATGATMMAAIKTVRAKNPGELIVAVPVASPDRLDEIQRVCDEVVCLATPEDFHSVGQFYQDFRQVDDEEVVQILNEFAPTSFVQR